MVRSGSRGHRLLAVVTVLLLLLAGGLVKSSVASAAGTGDDYPSYLRNAPQDSIVDPWSFYNRECTSFVAWRLNQQAGRTSAPWAFMNNMRGPNGTSVHFGNAYEWRQAAINGGWRVDGSPAVGSVAWWGPYQGGAFSAGHVAIVTAVNGDGSVNVEEYNYGSAGQFHTRNNVRATAYLHIADTPTVVDRDHDGVPDSQDQCPDQAGPASTGGCPDSDGDGTADRSDVCADLTGPVALQGCPAEVISSQGTADVNGDGRADYCRRVGDWSVPVLACTFAMGSGFGATISSATQIAGELPGAAWVDFNGDGRADYCRVANSGGLNRALCTLSTGTGFGAVVDSGPIDWGYALGRTWTDVNGDGRTDYCRRVGDDPNSKVQCTLSAGTSFGGTFTSGILDWGSPYGAAWVDFNGDKKADYCRVSQAGGVSHALCTLSTGSGFSTTVNSGSMDWGYDTGRGWTDFNGDGRADYCRRVGSTNLVDSAVQCTASTGRGFGSTVTSSALDWGYIDPTMWTGTTKRSTPPKFVSLAPSRILDTRNGTGAPKALVPAAGRVDLQVTGVGGVPAGAGAVVLNVTAVSPVGPGSGYVTVWPAGAVRPTASNLNFVPGQTIPNLAVAKVGAGGKVSLYTAAATHLIADVAGYFPAGAAYTGVTPVRVLDTRVGTGAPKARIAAGGSVTLTIAGANGVASNASAAVVNITPVGPSGAGTVTAFPAGVAAPVATSVSFRSGQTIAGLGVVKLGTGGKITLRSTASTDLIVDLAGWVPAGGDTVAFTPARLVANRAVGSAGSFTVQVAGVGGVPSNAKAVQVTVTASSPSSAGYLTVYPTGGARPVVSNVNYTPGGSVSNSAIVKVGTGGTITVYASNATAVTVDTSAYWTP